MASGVRQDPKSHLTPGNRIARKAQTLEEWNPSDSKSTSSYTSAIPFFAYFLRLSHESPRFNALPTHSSPLECEHPTLGIRHPCSELGEILQEFLPKEMSIFVLWFSSVILRHAFLWYAPKNYKNFYLILLKLVAWVVLKHPSWNAKSFLLTMAKLYDLGIFFFRVPRNPFGPTGSETGIECRPAGRVFSSGKITNDENSGLRTKCFLFAG